MRSNAWAVNKRRILWYYGAVAAGVGAMALLIWLFMPR
jgi:hypothetical protein